MFRLKVRSARRDAVARCGLFALAALVVAGCGGGGAEEVPSGTLAGVVTLNGSPAAQGQVSVYSAELGVGASAVLDEEGRFEIAEPLQTGTYAVAVLPPEAPPPQEEIPVSAAPQAANIPAKYRDHRTSGVTVEIREGENEVAVSMTE